MQVGRRDRNRPRGRWEDCVQQDMEERGISECGAKASGRGRSAPATPITLGLKPEGEEFISDDVINIFF